MVLHLPDNGYCLKPIKEHQQGYQRSETPLVSKLHQAQTHLNKDNPLKSQTYQKAGSFAQWPPVIMIPNHLKELPTSPLVANSGRYVFDGETNFEFVLCHFAVLTTEFGIVSDYVLFFICDGWKIMSVLVLSQFTLLFWVSVLFILLSSGILVKAIFLCFDMIFLPFLCPSLFSFT